jgi:large subunit ribosomal protein L38
LNLKIQGVYYLRGNIENGDGNTGKEYIDYIQPFPMRGTGWHRCVFLLFEHKNKIEFDLKSNDSSSKFSKRDFKTLKFYLNNQKDLVPVGLSFFQTEWDISVRNVFHNHLSK